MSAPKIIILSPATRSERRYDLHLTVGELKSKLELVTGIPADQQLIHVYSSEEDANSQAPTISLSSDDRPLGFYSLTDGQVLKVTDADPSGGSNTDQYTDVSQVEKFELTEEEYAKRKDTVRAYKERNNMGRFAPREENKQQQQQTPSSTECFEAKIPVGSRCEVDLGEWRRLGTVRFVGPTKFGCGSGNWVGVEYDEPVGKNDGSVDGEKYFSCRMKHGGFVRPEKVKLGDFPPEDLELDEESEM